jgi:hypothetical protein
VFQDGQHRTICQQESSLIPTHTLQEQGFFQNVDLEEQAKQSNTLLAAPNHCPEHISSLPKKNFHLCSSFSDCELLLTGETRDAAQLINPANCQLLHMAANKTNQCVAILLCRAWFHALSFQQFQALLTLFSKSFSSFPHGTCVLSVSNQCSALDGIYHLLCAPIPRNVTFRLHAVHKGLHTSSRTLTFSGTLFQEAYMCAFVGNASTDNTSRL